MSQGFAEIDVRALAKTPHRAILRLAAPTVFAMLLQSAVNEIDIVFFSHLPCPESSNAQAALLPSLIVVWLFGGSLSAISVGTQALVARRYAEGDQDAVGKVVANSAFFCLLFGAFLSVVGSILLPHILKLMVPGNAEVRQIAYDYSKWRLLAVISMSMTQAVKAFFDGIGRTYVHLIASLVMNVCNVTACYFLIFGKGGLPRMGAPGAGFSAFAATWIGLAVMLIAAFSERKRYRFARWSNISRQLTWDILRLSVPAALATIVMMLGFGLFSKVAGELDARAAHDPMMRVAAMCGGLEAVNGAATTNIVAVMKLTFTACIAFGTSTATFVGQSLGAREPELASKYGWASVRVGLLVFGVVGLCEGVLFTPQMVNFFTQSEAVRAATLLPMRMMGIATPIIAVAMILSEALFGAGNTIFVAKAQLILVFCVLVPLSYLLSLVFGFGLLGMWIAAVAYATCAAVVMVTKFRGGSWKRIQL